MLRNLEPNISGKVRKIYAASELLLCNTIKQKCPYTGAKSYKNRCPAKIRRSLPLYTPPFIVSIQTTRHFRNGNKKGARNVEKFSTPQISPYFFETSWRFNIKAPENPYQTNKSSKQFQSTNKNVIPHLQ